MVPPTSAITPEEVDRAKKALAAKVASIAAMAITETTQLLIIHLKKKLKDDCLSKLTISKSGHQATQCNKIIDALSGFLKTRTTHILMISFVPTSN